MDGSAPDDTISWDNITYLADLVLTSKDKHISLLGGEPTLHPYFPEICRFLIAKGLHVNVFTSGIASDEILNRMLYFLEDCDPKDFSFVVNANHPSISPEKQQEKLAKFLTIFSQFTNLGYNIYDIDFDLDFLFRMISQYGLKRHLRVGLAQPIPGEKNKCISLDQLPTFVERFMSYCDTFINLDVKVGFDCGIPMCLFNDDQLGKLIKVTDNNLRFGCGPAIDIGPDMTVWPCFPLSRFHKKSVFDFNTFDEIHTFYHDIHKKVRGEVGGIYMECDSCKYRRDPLCMGGCLAYTVSIFEEEEKIRFEEVYLS